MDFLNEHYLTLKALHVISVIAWMAGLFYLPRLFVYHCSAPVGSAQSETFKVMEAKLLRIIVNPAMIATWLFGILMLVAQPDWLHDGWLHVKLLAVVLLSGLHGMFARWRRAFAEDRNTRPERFYRIANEGPTVLMIVIVFMVVLKPF
ncbi:MAG: protoporphyrinogen oxidase HemJ [Rhodospirillaceae bacterium]|nr:protoporphyrinogen oxidase HemJ [Rhodospirillaceae bacterium]